jgi:hypothetical protein
MGSTPATLNSSDNGALWNIGSNTGVSVCLDVSGPDHLSPFLSFVDDELSDSAGFIGIGTSCSGKADYLEMERRWLSLARSYEFAERLSSFTEPFRNRRPSNE